jgi:hypothetical protein
MNLELNVPSRQIIYTSGPRGETFHCKIENKDAVEVNTSDLTIDVDIPDSVTVEPVSGGFEFPYNIQKGYEIDPGKSFNPSFRVRRPDGLRREQLRADTFEMFLFYEENLVDVKEIEVYG